MWDKIYLASKSPRRRELLAQMGVDFEVLLLDVPEQVLPNEKFRDYSARVCQDKVTAAWQLLLQRQMPLLPVLTADTEVVIGDMILGKPVDYADAFRMWRLLAGNTHTVITTVSLKYGDFLQTLSCESLVSFDMVSDAEIHAYLATGDYQDKSGAYGIKSYAGQFIRKIDGCFYSIMGLPLNAVRKLLAQLQASAH